jgi:tripartite-type tricarboxylate transporter receptor subunit TctC
VPGYEATTWSGIIAPAGLPRAIRDRLNTAVNAAVHSPRFLQRLASFGDEPGGGTAEAFGELIRQDSAKWGDVVRRSGARLD